MLVHSAANWRFLLNENVRKKISTRTAHAWEATFFSIRRFLHNLWMKFLFNILWNYATCASESCCHEWVKKRSKIEEFFLICWPFERFHSLKSLMTSEIFKWHHTSKDTSVRPRSTCDSIFYFPILLVLCKTTEDKALATKVI